MNPDPIIKCYPRKEIGKILKNAREQKHLSQQEVADRLFISRPEVSKMEAGKVSIPVTRFLYYCLIVDISPSIVINKIVKIINPSH